MDLLELLPKRDFDLKMRFTKGEIPSFYDSRRTDPAVLAERRTLLAGAPEKYSAMLPEGEDLLDETIALARKLETITGGDFSNPDALARCQKFGELWESDFLLMKPDPEGVFRLYGGCVCFPSHWGLADKIGLPMAAIHQPVPGLNEKLGRQIDGFLQRIKPDISWERGNWGLSRSPELNLHPSLDRPRLDPTVTLDEVWWRLEEQSLVALPQNGGILFGIKLVIRPFAEIKEDSEARSGMMRALETMEDEMADYKGILSSRQRLLDLLAT